MDCTRKLWKEGALETALGGAGGTTNEMKTEAIPEKECGDMSQDGRRKSMDEIP
jgi:hypothetical protein